MLNYDFHNLLSAFEFECFSRDLINAHEGLGLANFAEGRDGGIDLRYTHGKGKSVIVQAKRYKTYTKLKSELKKEIDKVKRLNPKRYMISTTVNLTPNNKQEIMTMFSPYILCEHDIWAKQDLNKHLAQHTDIEQQYYKLWLASTGVLNNILNKDIVNWTGFEKKEIQETVRTYVMNDSFSDALKKLMENRYVVISGEPGIGKTTLARVLVAHLLSDKFTDKKSPTNFEEFYYTNNNINDLVKVMQTGKRQVFFYDDFLGQVTLEEGEKNFDSRIVAFIKACQREKDKLFILATREYILQQGLVRYGRFNEGKGIEMSKCVVDMGKYTRFVRAQILYNHLVANEIPQVYINAILKDKNYLKLIDHPHFSPRIIQTFLSNGTHEHCKPEEYFDKIKGFFDHPDSVWLGAFERLSDMEKEALLVLNTMGTPVMYDDWKEAYAYFFHNVHKEANYLDDADWNEAVRVLQDNFIKIGKGRSGMFVDFHNPGIKDVLLRYLSQKADKKRLLINSSLFIEQLFGILIGYKHDQLNQQNPIPVIVRDAFFKAFERIWGEYRSCQTALFTQAGTENYYARFPEKKVDVLRRLSWYEALGTPPYYVEQKMTQDLMTDPKESLWSQLNLLEKADITKTNIDMEALFANYCARLNTSSKCLDFAKSTAKLFPDRVDYLESDELCAVATECLKEEIKYTKETDLEDLDTRVQELCDYIPSLAQEQVVWDIRRARDDYFDYVDAQAEAYQDDYEFGGNNALDEDERQINNLFATIRERS